MPKKLFRTRRNSKICGVCAGIAEYLNIDATVIRIIMILLALAGGSGLLFYIICVVLIPADDDYDERRGDQYRQ